MRIGSKANIYHWQLCPSNNSLYWKWPAISPPNGQDICKLQPIGATGSIWQVQPVQLLLIRKSQNIQQMLFQTEKQVKGTFKCDKVC